MIEIGKYLVFCVITVFASQSNEKKHYLDADSSVTLLFFVFLNILKILGRFHNSEF
jgi:hypothetical protein